MEVRLVKFNDDDLLVSENEGKVFVAVRWVCTALGMDRNATRVQMRKIQADVILQKGCTKMSLPTSGGVQEVFCLELNYLPLWLAKINANILKGSETKKKLVQYQLRAKDVLANAFVKDAEQAPQTSSIIPQTYSAALRLAANLQEKIEALEPKAEQYDQFMEARGFQTMNHVAKSLGTGRNRMMRFLRVRGVFMMDNTPYQRYINQGLFAVKQRVIMGRPCVQPFASPKGIAFIAKVMR